MSKMSEIRILNKESYPPTLANAPAIPPLLYIRGELRNEPYRRYLCIVGSRTHSRYGTEALEHIISGLANYPISIVSGLALGIDGAAHEIALRHHMHCVAFPGSTLQWDRIYPYSHLSLAERIVENGGALLSQWEVGYDTGSWAFPVRNRLMAGISHATLIVEAAKKSGSLQTAKYAEDYNRDVMTIPGSILDRQSYGPHMLIKRGAIPVTCASDILEALGFDVSTSVSLDAGVANLDEQSKAVLDALKYCGQLDNVAVALELPIHEVNKIAANLELAGLITSDFGAYRVL